MKFSIPKRHLPFEIAYFVSLVILLLNQINCLPMAETLRKVKYPYVLFVAILVVINPKVKRGIKASLFVILMLLLHNYLYGHVFVNGIVAAEIEDNTSQMMWFLLFVLVTFLYVAQNNFYKGFILLSYYATGLQLVVAAIKYRSNFVNPLWALIHAFTADTRFKNAFGFIHPGYTSNACFTVIVISIFFFEMYRKTEEFKKLWFWISFLVIDGLAGCMLMAATERSGIISTFMVVFWYLFFVFFNIRFERKTLWILIGLMAVAVTVFIACGGLAAIWGESNRQLNIIVNYPLFVAYGDFWTGLGFIENAGFHADRNLFPMPTSSLDMYYVYIFFSTGLLGTIMIGLVLVVILVKLLINKRTNMNIIAIGFYLTMLFFAIWQSNLFTHRYISSYVISVIFLCTMCKDCCMGETECSDIKSTV